MTSSHNHLATLGEMDDVIIPKEKFTVKKSAKVDVIVDKQKDKKETTVALALVKWFATIIIFLGVLTCLVASKLTLISIAQTLNSSDTKITDTSNLPDIAFVMIILIMLIPNLISFIRMFIISAFSSVDMWPSKKSFFFGITGSLLEVAGLSAFTLVLVPTSQNFGRSILFMNGIFIFSILFQFISEIRKFASGKPTTIDTGDRPYKAFENEKKQKNSQVERKNHLSTSIRLIAAGLIAIGGFVYVMYTTTTTVDRIVIPLFMLVMSMAWSPKIFKLQTQPSRQFDDYEEIADDESFVDNIRIKTSRNRITLVTSVIKMVLIIVVAFGLNYFLGMASTKQSHMAFKNGFEQFRSNTKLFNLFWIQISFSFLGYLLCWLSCTMNLQKVCFVVPLLLSTPIAVAFSTTAVCQWLGLISCDNGNERYIETIILGLLLWISQILSYSFQFFKSQQFLMAPEELLFWLPSYDGCLLEQYILLNRKNEVTDEFFVNYHEIVKNSHIYICTTMYHEADYEMEQLLESLAKVDMARKECSRQFEAHIFFDDGARGDVVKLYALQLLSLVKETMDIDPGRAFKLETPYGLQLKWALPNGMPFVIHLKDKVKVKSKKRWSQVMYMSYVLDFKQSRSRDDLTYILATDADVKFTPNDVMALMDLMSRSPTVGAVCGRTHPMGSGPMVWYQIFDYAIGHWLLKVANHVCGSVLCSPGCFSVYRARAIRDVLPLYASGVDCAMDFLMKDMGEDRWFCTLLVEAGWRLEYCATAEDSTYCPETFEEFFKQRRRWGPSTFANSLVVLEKQSGIRGNNNAISFFFIIYQMILMVSSIIGPSTVLLVIAGGLQYAYPNQINLVWVLVFLVVLSALFTVICLFCSQDTQLKWAKFLTFLFAIIMSITFVGIILQTVDDIRIFTKTHPTASSGGSGNITTAAPENTIRPYMFSPPTWYLFIISGVFILTAILHGLEGIYLIHGIWYLLCLPSGYLLLTIYSVANLTDRSWGTREGKTAVQHSDTTWHGTLARYFKYFCWCFVPPHLREQPEEKRMIQEEEQTPQEVKSPQSKVSDENVRTEGSDEPDGDFNPYNVREKLIDVDDDDDDRGGESKSTGLVKPKKSAMKKPSLKRFPSSEMLDNRRVPSSKRRPVNSGFRFPGEKTVKFSAKLPKLNAATPVEEWLPSEYQVYVPNFKEHGYDTVAFIAGSVKEKDLVNIGITNRGHRKRLIFFIDSLPPEEMFQEVPENVEEWLTKLGLEEYWPRFLENSYTEARDLADIKYLSRDDISSLFEIKKEGHLKRLSMATSVLQYPTKAQTRIREARKAVMADPPKQLKTDNADDGAEFEFWTELRDICLLPEQAAFNQSGELVEKLGDLRDTCLLVLTVANVLWLSFMVTIMEQGDKLAVIGSSFASVAFLFVYSLVLALQFLSLLWNRMETAIHFLARAPFKPGHMKSNWAWRDTDLPAPPAPELLDEIRRRRRIRLDSGSSNHSNDYNAPLIKNSGRSISVNE